MIPSNAQHIIDARKRGFKPTFMILVSMIGRLNEINPTVYIQAGRAYDWRWVVGLELCIFAEAGVSWSQTAKDILKWHPKKLFLWDANRREGTELWTYPHPADIEKPPTSWRHVLDYIPWLNSQNKEFDNAAYQG